MRRRLLIVLTLAWALLLPAPSVFAAGTNSNINSLNSQLQAVGEDLDNANAVVRKALAAYNVAHAALQKAQAALRVASANAAAATAADRRATTELGAAQARADAAARKLAATEQKLNGEHRLMSQLISQVYRSGPLSQFDALLSAQSPEDLTERLQILQSWTQSKAATIDNLTIVRTQVAQQKLVLQQLEAQLQMKKDAVHASALVAQDAAAKAKAAQVQVDAALIVQAKALKVAQSHRNDVKKRYDIMAAELKRLKAEARAGSKLGAGLTFTGELIWPIPGGRITQGVGPRRHPVYGYRSCHTGLDIGARTGTPIHVAASGVVVSVLNGGPYGLHTLVAHGSGMTTLYAHQSASKVRAGESVKAGQVIGLVGSTGWVTGPHLHFEVRIDGNAYDPRGWFGGRKTPISSMGSPC